MTHLLTSKFLPNIFEGTAGSTLLESTVTLIWTRGKDMNMPTHNQRINNLNKIFNFSNRKY